MTARGALRAIGVLGAFQVGVMLVNLARIKVVAVEGGPAELGLLTLIDQIVVLVALGCTFSLPFASVKFLSFAHSRDGQSFARLYTAFRRVLIVMSALGLAGALVIALSAPGVLGSEVAKHRELLILGLAAVPAINLLSLLTRAVAAAGRARASAAITLAQWTAIAVFASTGLLIDGLRGYFAGSAVGMFLVLVGGTVYLRRRKLAERLDGRVRAIAELRQRPGVMRFALVQSVLTLTTPLAYLIARYAVIGEGGLAEAGLLAAAFGVSQALTSLLMPACALFLTPALNRDEAPAAKLERALQYRRALMWALAAMTLPLLLFPELVLEILFATEFASASSFVYLFVFAEALVLVAAIHQALLIGLDDFTVNVVFVVITQAVMCVLVLVLVPLIGIPGVALALVVDYALLLALTTWRLKRRHEMAMLSGVGPYLPAALAVLVALGALVPTLSAGAPAVIAAKVGVLGVAAAAVAATTLRFKAGRGVPAWARGTRPALSSAPRPAPD